MRSYFEKLQNIRTALLERTKHLSVKQYNIIPPGFRNNIIWNMGHILMVSEEMLGGKYLDQHHRDKLSVYNFKKGSVPEGNISEAGILLIRDLLKDSSSCYKILAWPETDVPPVDQALAFDISMEHLLFLIFHENLHCRSIAVLQQLIER